MRLASFVTAISALQYFSRALNNVPVSATPSFSLPPDKIWDPVPPPRDLKQLIKSAEIFCFDVDSTLIRSESIDDLAEYLGVGDSVRKITSAAMGGSMSYTEALKQRLDLMRPSQADIARFLVEHPPILSDGVSSLCILLCANGLELEIFFVFPIPYSGISRTHMCIPAHTQQASNPRLPHRP